MRRLICSVFALTLIPLLAACQSTLEAQAEGWLAGRVVGTEGRPLAAQIGIGDQRVTTDAQGRFAISPNEDLVYRLEFEADGYYPMRHTFSSAELLQDSTLDVVVLVQRQPE